jgi:hypothetical protein
MESLDCPSGDQFTPVRTNTVTVQQALAMWNDAFVLRSTEHMAARLEREATALPDQVDKAVELVLGRPPAAGERQKLIGYASRHGLANLCRLLFNTNEFMFVN